MNYFDTMVFLLRLDISSVKIVTPSKIIFYFRTKLFFCWGMVSAWFLYLIFMLYVPSFRVISTKRILTCNVLFAWTHYALYHAKKDPGIITRSPSNTLTDTYSIDIKSNYNEKNNEQSPDFSRSSHTHDAIGDEDVPNANTSQV